MSEQLYWIDSEDGDWEKMSAIDKDGESLGTLVPVDPGRLIDIDDPKVRERMAYGLAALLNSESPDYGNGDWLLETAAGLEDDDEN